MSTQDEDALELAVESALAEYWMRCDQGQPPDREQFLARNPEMRERLETLLSAADWIEQLAGPTADSLNSGNVSPLHVHPTDSQALNLQALGDTISLSPGSAGTDGRSAMPSTSDPNAATLSIGPSDQAPLFSIGSLTSSQDETQHPLPCRFGEYLLERVLGRGGMGVVYAGRQVHLERPVAIKMIRSGALASSEEVQRFYTEARSAAKLDHPNIVTVYHCGEQDGHHFFSMDLVDGTDLAKLIQHGPMEPQRAARYVRDVARAIQFAHERGILHRDLKPANVLVDEYDQVHVTDFGLAKSIEHDTGLTATGAALGTPSYMSPEQASGRNDEHAFQTDVYSLGAVLFALVTGQPPFHAASVMQTLLQVLHRPAPLARQVLASVPADLETIIAKCLHKIPERRYASAAELADDLQRYLNGQPIEARRQSPMRRAAHWLLGVPIVAALAGKRVIEPSPAHVWVQRGFLVCLVVFVAALLVRWPVRSWRAQQLPSTIRFAAGQAGGSYDRVGRTICDQLSKLIDRPTMPETTQGSIDNRQRLIDRQVDLALLQASTLKSNQIAVIAPLYYEAIHILVRQDAEIRSLADLKGRQVVVGPERSGSRSVARRILQKHGLEMSDIQPISTEWLSLDDATVVDAAIVVIQVGNTRMNSLLSSQRYRLLPLEDAVEFSLEDPAFHLLPLTAELYPGAKLPSGGVTSVATTAYLATRTDAPDGLVQKALEAIYTPEVLDSCHLLAPETVADWQVSWHRAADKYFERYRVQP